MTSLLSAPARIASPAVDPRHRRPLLLVACLGGVVAAGALLTVCLGAAVTGWFLTDAAPTAPHATRCAWERSAG